MLQVILGVIRCISDFQKPCILKTAGLGVKDTSRSLCYPVYVVIVFHLVKQSAKPLGFLFEGCNIIFLLMYVSQNNEITSWYFKKISYDPHYKISFRWSLLNSIKGNVKYTKPCTVVWWWLPQSCHVFDVFRATVPYLFRTLSSVTYRTFWSSWMNWKVTVYRP